MAKKQMNPKARAGLDMWRANLPKDKQGNPIYPKRKPADKILDEKKAKLSKMMKEVDALKAEIAVLDARVNKNKIAELIKGMTAEEIAAKLGKSI